MKYEVRILRAAEKEMDKLSALVHHRLSQKLLLLEQNPRPRGSKRLTSREEYRLRVGNYRILYTINDKNRVVTIFSMGHRREVYR